MYNKALYGLDKKGGFKLWSIDVVDKISYAEIIITHGKDGGSLQTKVDIVRNGKQGRSYLEQAILQAKAKVNKNTDKGYRENKADLEELEILPMLASDYRKQGHRIKYPCWVAPKYDGVRCLAIRHADRVELKSRGGKEYTVPHIQNELMGLMCEGGMLDGELYIHGLPLEHIVPAVKKPNKNTPRLKFIVFDSVSTKECFEDRIFGITHILLNKEEDSMIEACPYHIADSEQDMKSWHNSFVQEGYEGVMLRNLTGMYESGKRSADLQKYKEFIDEEFQIVDVLMDRNGNGVFKVFDSTANDHFTVCYGNFEQRVHQVDYPEEYIGKWLTVRYQARYADSRLLQFPVGKLIREGKVVGGEFKPEI
jgi:DNA ligase-1